MNGFYSKCKLLVFIFCISLIASASGQYVNRASSLNMDLVHVSEFLMGGGIAFQDINNDGLIDFYLTGGENPDRLYINAGNGFFENIAESSGIAQSVSSAETYGTIIGDINNDGCNDIFVTSFSREDANFLFLNNCDGTFTDISEQAGIIHNASSTSATFLDINKDGLLDIYVANYIENLRFLFDDDGNQIGFDHDCYTNYLYINNGDNTFSEQASDFGMNNADCSLAVLATDYDHDNNIDIMVANDFGQWVVPNKLYKNDFPNNSFLDVSSESGFDEQFYAMGFSTADLDRDGLLEYYITNIGRNYFMVRNEAGLFEDIAQEKGIANILANANELTTGWGTFFFDYDNDGLQDLFVSNGYIPAASFINNSLFDPNVLFHQNPDGTFENIAPDLGLDNLVMNRGAAFADINYDGMLDILVSATAKNANSNSSYTVSVYENELSNSNNWVQISLEGTISNRNAYGAKVKLHIDGESYYQELTSGTSSASQNSPILHYGLGTQEQVDSVSVIWPNGLYQVYDNPPVNEVLYLVEGEENYQIMGCMDESSDSFNPNATKAIGCYYRDLAGCTDPNANNYNEYATSDDGSCNFEEVVTSNSDNLSQSVMMSYFKQSNLLKFNFKDANHQNPDLSDVIVFIYDIKGRRMPVNVNTRSSEIEVNVSNLRDNFYLIHLFSPSKGEFIYKQKIALIK